MAAFLRGLSTGLASNRLPVWDGCFPKRFINEIGFRPHWASSGPDSLFGHPSWNGCFLKTFVNEIGLKPPWAPPGPDFFFWAPFLGWLLSKAVYNEIGLKPPHGPDSSFRAPYLGWLLFSKGLLTRLASNRPGRLLAQIPPFGHPSWDGCFLQRFVNEIGFKPPRVPPGPDSSFRAPFVRAQDPCENILLYVSLHVYVCILYMHVHASVRTCVRGRSVFWMCILSGI